MNENILLFLKSLKNKKIISLGELEKQFSGDMTYEVFAYEIKNLVELNILKEVKKHGTNNKPIPLANTYRLNRYVLKKEFVDEIQCFQIKVHKAIDLSSFLSLDEKQWKKSLSQIKIIDNYLKENGFPADSATSQERSFQIVGDEKWIDEGGGKVLLERLKIWDKLKINNEPDPLMLAINPNNFCQKEHKHLIVENKATYYGLLDALDDTDFTTLIYGAGWKIISGISCLEKQISLQGRKHILYYFGDLDFEGINIWNCLNKKVFVKPILDFYKELLKKDSSRGKENQNKNEEALSNFLEFFNKENKRKIEYNLKNKGYYPQEGLSKKELQSIWRKGKWL